MTRKRLERALADREYVTVVRRKGWEHVHGYVAAVGEDWFALVAVPDALFDGISILRIKDVRQLETPSHPKRAKRALTLDGLWPPAVPDALDLDSTRGVLFTAGALSRTLGIANERKAFGYFVASVDRITKRRLENREITPGGRWGDDMVIRLDAITKVVLWDPYVEKITAIADAQEPKRRSS